mgnify:CR=1 FL=1
MQETFLKKSESRYEILNTLMKTLDYNSSENSLIRFVKEGNQLHVQFDGQL